VQTLGTNKATKSRGPDPMTTSFFGLILPKQPNNRRTDQPDQPDQWKQRLAKNKKQQNEPKSRCGDEVESSVS
jgi:hypothetical protein